MEIKPVCVLDNSGMVRHIGAIKHVDHGVIAIVENNDDDSCLNSMALCVLLPTDTGVYRVGDLLADYSPNLYPAPAIAGAFFCATQTDDDVSDQIDELQEEFGEEYAADVRNHLGKIAPLDGPPIDPMGAWDNNPYALAIKSLASESPDPYRYLINNIESDPNLGVLAVAARTYRENHPYCKKAEAMSYVPRDFEKLGIAFDDTPRRVINTLWELEPGDVVSDLYPIKTAARSRTPK